MDTKLTKSHRQVEQEHTHYTSVYVADFKCFKGTETGFIPRNKNYAISKTLLAGHNIF